MIGRWRINLVKKCMSRHTNLTKFRSLDMLAVYNVDSNKFNTLKILAWQQYNFSKFDKTQFSTNKDELKETTIEDILRSEYKNISETSDDEINLSTSSTYEITGKASCLTF